MTASKTRKPAQTLATTALAGLTRLARAADPLVRRGLGLCAWALVHGLRALARGTRALACAAHRQRRWLFAAGHRVAWWAALVLLVLGGRPVLGLEPLPERGLALAPFVLGLLLCAAVRLLAPSRRLRVAALGLGALHGAATVLVWTAFAG